MFVFKRKVFNIFLQGFFVLSLFLATFLIGSYVKAAEVTDLIPVPEVNISMNEVLTPNNLTITGISLGFSSVQVDLDGEFSGFTTNELGPDGWQDWEYTLPSDLAFGTHTLEFTTFYFNDTQSSTVKYDFEYKEKIDGPTLFAPVVNSETTATQPWIIGLSWAPATVDIYINEKYDGSVEVDGENEVIDFKYRPSSRLANGFHVVKARAKSADGQESIFSDEMIFEIRGAVAKMEAPDLPEEVGEFVPPVPAPTLLKPKNKVVTSDNKLVVSGVVHNEHYVKIYNNNELVGEFLPPTHESGVTSFTWQSSEPLPSGLHKVWASAINPRGQVSGQSNILRFIISEPDHPVIIVPGVVAGPDNSDYEDQMGDGKINEEGSTTRTWTSYWAVAIAAIILIAAILVIIWILSIKTTEVQEEQESQKNNEPAGGEKIDVKNKSSDIESDKSLDNEPIILGPDISYDSVQSEPYYEPEPVDNDYIPPIEDEFNDDEHMPPPPPPVDSPTLNI